MNERELFQAYGLRHDAPCYEAPRTERPFYISGTMVALARTSSVITNTIVPALFVASPGRRGRFDSWKD